MPAPLYYDIKRCTLGHVLVSANERGIAGIFLGDDAATLAEDCARLFPGAEQGEVEQLLAAPFDRIVAHIEAPAGDIDLPLLIEGTAFQKRVWQVLGQVPAGLTISYEELAVRVGTPRAIRAVASACAANRHAVVIPCHRAVRKDGSLSGYRWGIERKRALLEREAAARPARANAIAA